MLAFLDTCILCLKDVGSTEVKVYWKRTHTDKYLNCEPNHPLDDRRSVVRILLQRAESLTSEDEDKSKEVEYINNVLKMNRYKPWIFNTAQPLRNMDNVYTRETNRRQHAIRLPYITLRNDKIIIRSALLHVFSLFLQ